MYTARVGKLAENSGWKTFAIFPLGERERVNIYAGWNGSTETSMAIRTDESYVAVRAEDDSGRTLGTSRAVKPKS
jgi:hypothetical protein